MKTMFVVLVVAIAGFCAWCSLGVNPPPNPTPVPTGASDGP